MRHDFERIGHTCAYTFFKNQLDSPFEPKIAKISSKFGLVMNKNRQLFWHKMLVQGLESLF